MYRTRTDRVNEPTNAENIKWTSQRASVCVCVFSYLYSFCIFYYCHIHPLLSFILGYLIIIIFIRTIWCMECSLSIFSAYFYISNVGKMEKPLRQRRKIEDSFCLEFVHECLCVCVCSDFTWRAVFCYFLCSLCIPNVHTSILVYADIVWMRLFHYTSFSWQTERDGWEQFFWLSNLFFPPFLFVKFIACSMLGSVSTSCAYFNLFKRQFRYEQCCDPIHSCVLRWPLRPSSLTPHMYARARVSCVRVCMIVM